MTTLLTLLARAIIARPAVVLALAVLPSLAFASTVLLVDSDLSFMGVIDQSDPEVRRFNRVADEVRLGGSMFLLIEGPEEKLDDAVSAVEARLRKMSSVRTVVSAPPTAWLEEHAPWFVSRDIFDDWLRLATHPDDLDAPKRLAKALERVSEKKRGGVRLMQVNLHDSPLKVEMGGREFLAIEEVTQQTLAPFNATGSYAGLPAISAQDQSRTLGIVQKLTPISLLLVLLLLRPLERRVLRIGLVGLPLVLAGGATLGVVGIITGKLTVMESFFGIMIFGLGVDFAILMLVRLREEQAAGHGFDDALTRTLVGVGPSIAAGALTTAGAFLIVALAPDPTALHLGLSGGIGVALCLVLMLTVLPSCWTLLDRRSTTVVQVRELSLPFLGKLARHAALHPRGHLCVALFVLVIAAAGANRYRFETDLTKVFNRKVPAVQAVERVQELFGVNAGPWLVVVDTIDEARRVTDAFKSHEMFASADSIASLIPADIDARRAALNNAVAAAETQATFYEGLLPLVSDSEAEQLNGAIKLLRTLPIALKAGPPTPETLPSSLKSAYVTSGGRYIVAAYSKDPNMDGHRQRVERVAAQSIHPDATGLGALLEAIMAKERPWATNIFFGILVWVAIVLSVGFRRPRHVALSLVPVVLGVVVTFGALCWANVSFNLLTTLVVPLIIGLGVDSGIHVVHRMREFPDAAVDASASAVGRAMLMNTTTTCVGFTALMFTDHAGMESMGLVMLIGLPICLLASLSTVPALAVTLGAAPPPRA